MPDRATRHAQVTELCRAGREHARRGEHAEALARYLEAWELLPEPKSGWEISAGILAGVGDSLAARDAESALELLLASSGRTAGP